MLRTNTRWCAAQLPFRVSVVGALIGLLSSLAFAVPASASIISATVTLRNSWYDYCLDSNAAGKVYGEPCNGGANQKWKIEFFASIDGFDTYRVINQGNHDRCLDGNNHGDIYTKPCQNPNHWQKWRIRFLHEGNPIYWTFQGVETKRCLKGYLGSNGAQILANSVCNDTEDKQWRPGFP